MLVNHPTVDVSEHNTFTSISTRSFISQNAKASTVSFTKVHGGPIDFVLRVYFLCRAVGLAG